MTCEQRLEGSKRIKLCVYGKNILGREKNENKHPNLAEYFLKNKEAWVDGS